MKEFIYFLTQVATTVLFYLGVEFYPDKILELCLGALSLHMVFFVISGIHQIKGGIVDSLTLLQVIMVGIFLLANTKLFLIASI